MEAMPSIKETADALEAARDEIKAITTTYDDELLLEQLAEINALANQLTNTNQPRSNAA